MLKGGEKMRAIEVHAFHLRSGCFAIYGCGVVRRICS